MDKGYESKHLHMWVRPYQEYKDPNLKSLIAFAKLWVPRPRQLRIDVSGKSKASIAYVADSDLPNVIHVGVLILVRDLTHEAAVDTSGGGRGGNSWRFICP